MEGPISFWGYKEQESNLILPEHDDDDDDDDEFLKTKCDLRFSVNRALPKDSGVLESFIVMSFLWVIEVIE